MKITIWTLTTCIPGSPDPISPDIFSTLAEAEAAFDQTMRDEWEHNGYGHEFPGAIEAHEIMSDNESWGRYSMDSYIVTVSSP